MGDTLVHDYTELTVSPQEMASSSSLTYAGPREVLLNQPLVLQGYYRPQQIASVSLVAEDKYSLPVTVKAGAWQVKLNKGFQSPGARWLRLKGMDATGRVVHSQVIYLTVSNNPLTAGQALILKVQQDTLFKSAPVDSARLTAQQKVTVKAGQALPVKRYGFVDGHLRVELATAIAPIGSFGCFYEPHVQLYKGNQPLRFELSDVPTMPRSAQMLITTTTLIKAKPVDSSLLATNQQRQLLQGETLQITGYACMAGHFRVTLANPLDGFGDQGYVYWRHVALKQENRVIDFEPDALIVKAPQTTILKKRPVDSAQLSDLERYTIAAQSFYGVSSYALEDGHVKVALTEELPGFGNTGYLFPSYIQMMRGGKIFNPYPPQVELNVPYFSQRDNPRYSWATCNVTSIAMAMYYYGRRSQRGGQLEDELLQWCLQHHGVDSQMDHSVLSALIQTYGFKTSFSTSRKWSQVKEELIQRRPVILGGDFTASGHIICVVGYNNQGYIVNDPWGDALSGYTNTEGRKLLYPYSYMDRVAGPDGNIWAHFITK